MNCKECSHKIDRGQLLNCSKCKGTFHYTCLNIDSAKFREHRQELAQTIRCHRCLQAEKAVAKTPSGTRDNKTPKNTGNNGKQLLQNNPSIQSAVDTGNAPVTYIQLEQLLDAKMKTVLERMDSIVASVASVKKELKLEIERLKQDFTRTTDFLSAEQKDLALRLQEADRKVLELETEKYVLQSDVQDLKRRVGSMEKFSRSRNIEVQMVPENRNENLLNVLKSLYEVIKTPINVADIHSIRRVAKLKPDSDRPRTILVTLPSERYRDNMISAFRRYNKEHKTDPLNSSNIGCSGNNKIYVVEHLSAETKSLHAAARKRGVELSYDYVWVKYGNVYMRKNDTSKPIHIKDDRFLSTLT
ncbi:hypothetical protein NE865_00680 [Phthorimaea operculella]|nr:hypothetical protein NE865_00680 [Phthorimaea operculella]